jgi:drug/metabolite transporter (DMT)-like permease
MTIRVLAVWWATCLLWSTTFLFIRVGLRDIPAFTLAWMRLAVALAVLIPIALVRGEVRAQRWRDIGHVAAAGVLLLGLNYALVFWGAQFIPSGLVAVLQSGAPLVALGFACAIGQEQVSMRKIAALVLGVVGVAVIFGSEATASGWSAIAGAAAAFAGSVCVAAAYVWMKRHGRRIAPLTLTTIQSAAAVVPLACLALALEGAPRPDRWPTTAWAAVLYLGLAASVVAFWLNYWLLARMNASAMLMMGVAEVPIAIGLGAAFLGERLPAGTFLGATCVLIAVAGNLFAERVSARATTIPAFPDRE